MVFQEKKFSKLQYKKSSYGNGFVAELDIKENGNNINHFSWRRPEDFNKTVSPKLKKYGLINMDKFDVEEEIKHLNEFTNGL